MGELDLSHGFRVTKTRCPVIDSAYNINGDGIIEKVLVWLNSGAEKAEPQKIATPTQPAAQPQETEPQAEVNSLDPGEVFARITNGEILTGEIQKLPTAMQPFFVSLQKTVTGETQTDTDKQNIARMQARFVGKK